MIVFLLRDVRPLGARAYFLLATEDGLEVVNDGFILIILLGWHQHVAADIFRWTEEHQWNEEQHLQTHLIMYQYGAEAKQAKAIKPSEILPHVLCSGALSFPVL